MCGEFKLTPSVFAADLADFAEQVAQLKASGADMLHFDVMDGRFVERIAFGADHLRMLRAMTELPIEVHLMVERPEDCIASMIEAGADIVVFHVEATTRVLSCLRRIRALGAKAGVALSPATSEESLRYIVDDLDKVIVMTVNPGEGGQSFVTGMLPKIRKIRALLGDSPVDLGVDGSVDAQTIKLCAEAGANVFVSGGYLLKGSIAANMDSLRAALSEAG